MDLIVVGPGRAGLAVGLAAVAAGHRIRGVAARRPEAAAEAADRLGADVIDWESPLPTADLLVVAVRDDAIPSVAERLAGKARAVDAFVHLSGLTSVSSLAPLGSPVGSFHPLQTIPDPEVGANRLSGAWIAVTSADDMLADRLFSLAASMGCHPFELADEQKPLYHAAAAAAANFPLAALSMSRRLFEAADVEFRVAHPLVEAVIANAIAMGPEGALTGPVARGDIGTVLAQLAAVRAAAPDLAADFEAAVVATARVAGTLEEIAKELG